MNLLHKVSESLTFYDYFERYERDTVVPEYNTFKMLISAFGFVITFGIVKVVSERLAGSLHRRKMQSKLD